MRPDILRALLVEISVTDRERQKAPPQWRFEYGEELYVCTHILGPSPRLDSLTTITSVDPVYLDFSAPDPEKDKDKKYPKRAKTFLNSTMVTIQEFASPRNEEQFHVQIIYNYPESQSVRIEIGIAEESITANLFNAPKDSIMTTIQSKSTFTLSQSGRWEPYDEEFVGFVAWARGLMQEAWRYYPEQPFVPKASVN